MPFFSIIVPVYNTEKYLQRCVESILQQDCREFELILVDDGSSDSSAEICDWYKKEENVFVYHKMNGGVSSARNFGLKYARGKWIWFVDSDDYIVKGSLKKLYNFILENPCDLYIFNNDTREKVLEKSFDIFLEKYYFSYNLGFQLWNKIYLNSNIKRNKLQFDEEETIGEDLLFNMNYYLHMERGIYFVGENYYFYDNRPESAMNSKFSIRHIQQMRLYKKIISQCGQYIDEKNKCILFLMHFMSGISQSRKGNVTSKEYAAFFEKCFCQYKFPRKIWKNAIREFLDNEKSSQLGRIRVKFLLFLCRNRIYKMATNII